LPETAIHHVRHLSCVLGVWWCCVVELYNVQVSSPTPVKFMFKKFYTDCLPMVIFTNGNNCGIKLNELNLIIEAVIPGLSVGISVLG
jgi:hypothetical protein